jgi:hypothetical protein
MNEKSKNDKPRINSISFLLLWIVLVAGMSQLSGAIFTWLYPWMEQFSGNAFWRIDFLNVFLLAAFIAPVGKLLLKLRFGQWVKGWISASFLSMVLGLMPDFILRAFGIPYPSFTNLQSALIIAFAALPQVWILRRYVKYSWLYPFASVLGSFASNYVVERLWGDNLSAAIAFGSGTAIMGLMMLWLFSMPRSEEKLKRSEAEAVNSERLEDKLPENEELEEYYEEGKLRKRSDQA